MMVQGRELSFPVEVREARSWAAHFLVDRKASQRLIDHTGLRIAPAFGRALLTLAFVDYLESDLDTYHELAVAFLVKGPRGRGVYIH
ncbi:MAG: acetoacetate decarboxylase, partial [Actinomycetota bacterium]